jgi:class 3 adenylate cyclase
MEQPEETQATAFDPDLADPLLELARLPPPPQDHGEPDHVVSLPFRCPASLAWAVNSDTDRLNQSCGLSPYDYRDEPQEDGTSRRFFTTKANGLTLVGEEFFSAWENERWFELRRDYSKGPFVRSLHRMTLELLNPTDPMSGCTITHSFWMEPRGVLGRIWRWGFGRDVAPAMLGYLRESEQTIFDALDAERQDEGLLDELPTDAVAELPAYKAEPQQIARVEALAREANDMSPDGGIGLLATLLLSAHDDEVRRIQPYALARRWNMPRGDVLDGCLTATHKGLLNLRWDAICPHCRGDKANWDALDAVEAEAYCSSCNINFDVELDRSLEAVFTVHPQVRDVDIRSYCMGGPAATSHVMYQSMLKAGAHFNPIVKLPAGRFRLRVSGTDEYRWIVVEADAEVSGGELVVTDDAVEGDDLRLRPGQPAVFSIQNRSSRRALVVIETVQWANEALPAGELIAAQRFRDLFSHQMLTPGVSLAVQSVTIMFTDLVGSTAMYESIGDAAAFNLVWTHFHILTDIVRDCRGAIVKTIGDAIMAAFMHPDDALRAANELHDRVEAYVQEQGHEYPCKLKVGLHEGPAIVVQLNDRLDYFGGTINLAARVQGQSEGEDIVVTGHIARRTEDCTALRDLGWFSEDYRATLKGLEDAVHLLRFRRTRPEGGGDSFEALDMEL